MQLATIMLETSNKSFNKEQICNFITLVVESYIRCVYTVSNIFIITLHTISYHILHIAVRTA